MRMPGRFEWKILGVVLLVAALSAGTAGYAARYVLRGVASFAQHERQTSDSGNVAAEAFRGYFAERKEEFRRRTERLAATSPSRMADLAGTEELLRARIYEGSRVVDEWSAPESARQRAKEAPPSTAPLPPGAAAVGADQPPGRVLELTFGIPVEMYDRFVELRQALDLEQQREDVYEAFVSRYLREYLLFVVGLLAVVPMVGLYFARRATERVARLRDAALAVGAGDLSVRLRPSGRDELDELARSFDGMVGELEEARSRLAYLQKVSAWQEVARRLAHEIKNPLTPIQLAVQELASKYRGDDPAYRRLLETAVEILRDEITALRRLVEDFSAFAKLPKVEPAPLDLGAFLAEFERLHPEWQPFIEVVQPPAPVTAPCDRILFGRVLANLVENAVQAAEATAVRPKVRLSVEARPLRRRAVVLVDDNGPGVPTAESQRIFDPYVTSKPQGTGLGLAIVRKIVIDHGGDISVAPGPSPLGGARLMVEIPATA
jgi:two-component system, NtrC family, nitrogen regulation sensor histidine kinase NtrY